MRYPAYPAYRSTGFAHWPRVPEHWEAMRIKFVASIGNGSTPSRDESAYWTDGTIPWLNSSVVNQEVVCEADQFVTPAAIRECHLPLIDPPAVLVGITGEGRTRGMATTLAFRTTINQHLAYMKATSPDLDVAFLRRVFDSAYLYLRSESEGGGSTKGAITCAQLAEMSIPMPPHAEQQAIAAFLDWKTSQIDALIAKKQALIEKLKEKRLAVITQAVTKGQYSAVPMRNSGISWLGEVPKHWVVKRLRYCCEGVTSGSRGWAQYFAEDTGSLFLRITNLDRESIALQLNDIQRVDPPDGAEGSRTLTRARDVLISITADLGSVAVVPDDLEPAYVSQHLSLVRLDGADIDPRWIAYAVMSLAGKYQLSVAAYGGTKIQLSLGDIKDIVFCHPPEIHEQANTLKWLTDEVERCDKLIDLAIAATRQLNEYRTALITAAVTGQIDVRGVAVPATEWPGKTLGQSTPSMETV